jgi:hypothetical protein
MMSSYSDYRQTERRVDFVLKILVWLGLIVIVAMALAGCGTGDDKSRQLNLAVKGSYTPGEAAGTRIPIPQGGSDEKSRSTPTEPAK